jgi:hypothetical protein
MSLKMSQKSRQEMLEQARERYGRRGRQGRSRLLDEVCALCGYERKHAIKVLGGSRTIAGHGGRRGGSAPVYGEAERVVLKKIWLAAEQPCGKRLVAALPVWLPYYEKRYGKLAPALRRRLRRVSAGHLRGVVGNDHSLKVVFVEEAQDAKNIHCAYQTPSTPRRGVQHVVDGRFSPVSGTNTAAAKVVELLHQHQWAEGHL